MKDMKTWQQAQSEYHARIRNDPVFRLQEMMADIEAERAPAWSSFDYAQDKSFETPPQPIVVLQQDTTTGRFLPLRAELNYLTNKLNEHISKSKKFSKRRKDDAF